MSDDEKGWQTVPTKKVKATLKHGSTYSVGSTVHVIHDRPLVNTTRPYHQQTNTKLMTSTQKSAELRKVAEADGGKPKMLTATSRAAMAAARVAFGLTQKELDVRGSFPTNSCSSWESGRICPSSIQIQAIHKILGVKLEWA